MSGPSAVTEELERLVGFGRFLRAQGLPVGTGRIFTFCRAVAALAPARKTGIYWAGRCALVGRKEDFSLYDRAFDTYFGSIRLREEPTSTSAGGVPSREPQGQEVSGESTVAYWEPAEPGEITEGIQTVRLIASSTEVLRTKSFAELSDQDLIRARRLIHTLAINIPQRRSRRLRRARSGRHFDVRRTLRSSLATQGEPFERAWRTRRPKTRPLVLILDVSASMSPYSRALLQFAFAAMTAGHRVEVFCFATRLTRITRALKQRDPDDALDDTGRLVRDWEGGTRIGASIKQLLDAFGQHASVRGAIVVLCSDGLERGEPELLAAQMARLGRLAHRVVWVNPLKGDPRYQPLARGMAASLPYVDVFLAGHNIKSLEALIQTLIR
jgi:uncharacterized protein with von Willebrand factor type A (vWA) domain